MSTKSRPGRRATLTVVAASLALAISACSNAATTAPSAAAGSPAASAGASAGASPAASGGFTAKQEAVAGGSAKVGLPAGGIDHLEPALWYFATTWEIAFATCTTLVTFPDAEGQPGDQVVGGLADLPTISSDGMTYTFKLKSGITFADGKPITAADIQYTWLRMLSSKMGSPADGFFTDIAGAEDYTAGKATTVSGITTSGTDTITFTLTHPAGSFLYRMTMPFTCPVPSGTSMDPVEDGSALGTGPYVVKSYTPNRELVLEKNAKYDAAALGARGKLDQLTIVMNVDPAQAGLQIRAGQLATYMDRLASADAAQALNDPTLAGRVFRGPLPATTYLFLNYTVAPFDNVKVRQAVNYAVDRDTILKVWGGPSQGGVTDQVLPPTMPGWEDAQNYPDTADLTKAKQLMQEAGVTTPVKTTLRVRNDAPGYVQIAQAVQAQLLQIGIEATIQSAPDAANQAITTVPANKVPMGISTWTQDYPDPDDFFGPLLDGNRITPTNNNNYASFNEPSINQAIEGMDAVTGAERATKWNEIDKQTIGTYAAWAPLLNPAQVALVAKGICGFVNHPVYTLDLTTLGNCQ
jgi:peptide/nickel transport system substrate-binding protein